jgi:hypothetical protein
MTYGRKRNLVRTLEAVGIRRVSDAMARVFGDDPLPCRDADASTHSWAEHRLRTTSETARYYAWANFFRGLLYVPLIDPLRRFGTPVVNVAYFLLGFHAICILVELHRHSLLRYLQPSSQPRTPRPRVRMGELPHSRFFEPKRWETVKRYQTLGLEKFRQLVKEYDRRTRGAEPAMAPNLAVMELDSRIAETMHWVAMLFNVPFAYVLGKNGSPWVWLAIAIMALDFYLVLLQRYHRIRIRATAAKRKRRDGPTGTEAPLVVTSTGQA